MKIKLIFAVVLLVLIFLVIRTCSQKPQEVVNLADALIISPYIYDKSISDPVAATAEGIKGKFEALNLNEVRYLNGYFGVYENINIMFEFNGGMIELISDDCDVQLSIGDGARPFRNNEDSSRTISNKLSVADSGYIAINPLASKRGYLYFDKNSPDWDRSDGYVGRKYYLTVNAYDFFDTSSPVITAKLELIQLEDTAFPDGNGSSYYSIELISYEYSDTYKLMEDHK